MKRVFLVLAILGLCVSGAMAASFPSGTFYALDGSGVTPTIYSGTSTLTVNGLNNIDDTEHPGTKQAYEFSMASGNDYTLSATVSSATKSEVGLVARGSGFNGYTLTTNFDSGTFNFIKVTNGVGENMVWEQEPWINPTGSYTMTLSTKGNWLMGRLTDGTNTKTYMLNDSSYSSGSFVGMLLSSTKGTAGQAINGTWNNLSYGGSNILLGDTDLNFTVDITDLGNLLANYGATSGKAWATGDNTGDGKVDITDLGNLLANYGKTINPLGGNAESFGAASGSFGTVPEPGTVAMLVAGVLGLLGWAGLRRRS